LTWERSGEGKGRLTIDTPWVQAAEGWLSDKVAGTRDVEFRMVTRFCAVSLASLDNMPLGSSRRILVVGTACCANTRMKWNEKRDSIGDRWGGPPITVEPVEGEMRLRRDAGAPELRLVPLDGRGLPKGEGARTDRRSGMVWSFPLRASDGTVWHVLSP
jgi:hypothetical protein